MLAMQYVRPAAESAVTRDCAPRARNLESDFPAALHRCVLAELPLRHIMRRSYSGDSDEAVSPVIATVLLMAITVLLASAVYLMVSNAIDAPEKGRPYAKVSVRALDNGYQIVQIADLSQNLETYKVEFRLIPPDGSNLSSVMGNVSNSNVYGAIGTPVSFHDRDASFTVNRGDYFIIVASTVGSDTGGWTYHMRYYGSSGSVELVTVPLPATA